MARLIDVVYTNEDCDSMDDWKGRSVLREQTDKEEDALYCLTLLSNGRPDVLKLIVDSVVRKESGPTTGPIDSVHAHFFGMPTQRIVFQEPYLFFGSLEELREYYRKMI